MAAQIEVGLMAGISTYQGDLSPSNLKTSFSAPHAAIGIFVRKNINYFLTGRVSINYGTVSGDDAKEGRNRNLSFRSDLLEFSLTGEWNILGFQPYALERVFTPYLFGGVAFFHYNPRAKYEGEWVELQPLGTEGQGLPDFDPKYKLIDFAIPFGIGVKYAINDTWNVGLEFGLRKTFTDHLDDVSGAYVDEDLLLNGNGELAVIMANRTGEPVQGGTLRGNPDNDDWYLITGLSVSYNFLDNGLVGSRSKSRKKKGCYNNF